MIEAMWRRSRLEDKHTTPVAGIERVYVGHSVFDQVTDLGNVRYLETGDCFAGGHLTLVEIGGSEEIVSVPNPACKKSCETT